MDHKDIAFDYDDRGRGARTLVLVHGHPFNRSMWSPQVEYFVALGMRVLAPDLRGYGRTPARGDKTDLSVFATDIASLLDSLEIDQAVMCGLSMGGQIVMEFHRLFQGRLGGMVLADTSARAESPEGKRARMQMADRLIQEGMAPYAREVLDQMVAPTNLAAVPGLGSHVYSMMCSTSPLGAAAALRGRAERPDYRDMLAKSDVPTLLVVGEEDPYTPPAEAERLHAAMGTSTLEVIGGAAHMPNLERPGHFNAAISAWMDAVGIG